jgi:uncharacterized protein YecE (DUF72 family)
MKQEETGLAANGIFVGTSPWKYEGWLNAELPSEIAQRNGQESAL